MNTLYRTNSFTGNDNPVRSTAEVLTDDPNQRKVLYSLNCDILVPSKNTELVEQVQEMLFPDGSTKLQEFQKRNRKERLSFYEEVIAEVENIFNIKIPYCCWFSNKAIVMSRSKGYGTRLHKDNGILKCNESHFVLLQRGFDILACFKEPPKFQQDTATNRNLISKEQLFQLLLLEESCGKLLAETCLKKDVINVLKRAEMGLLEKDYAVPTERWQQRLSDIRERNLQNLL